MRFGESKPINAPNTGPDGDENMHSDEDSAYDESGQREISGDDGVND